jgi:hypothetical protein
MPRIITVYELANKLFCTFTKKEELNETLEAIKSRYTILYDKIFVLESEDSEELICTYNIDPGNVGASVMANTILLHRKKESNTLYTINALNTLIKVLNEGIVDPNYKINWNDYKNTILLTQGPDLRKLKTSIHNIVNI